MHRDLDQQAAEWRARQRPRRAAVGDGQWYSLRRARQLIIRGQPPRPWAAAAVRHGHGQQHHVQLPRVAGGDGQVEQPVAGYGFL